MTSPSSPPPPRNQGNKTDTVWVAFWDTLCPGIRMTMDDKSHYMPAVQAAMAAFQVVHREADDRLLAAAKGLLERYIIMGCGEGPEALATRLAISEIERLRRPSPPQATEESDVAPLPTVALGKIGAASS